jgi:hypothetical protein
MNFPCPYCRKELNLLELMMESDLHAIHAMLAAFGKHSHVVMGYCYLFGVSPLKTKTKKLRLLLEEMKTLFETQEFKYQKRLYAISQAGIAEALNVVVHRHFSDYLESHNYLKKIMIGIAEMEGRTAGIAMEKALHKKEAALMSGNRGHESAETHRVPGRELASPGTSQDAQRAENLRRVRELTEGIG